MDSRRKGGLNGEGRGERCQRGNLSICSPIDGHLHCFQGLVIRNRATINILIQFFFFFSRYKFSFLLEFLDHKTGEY